MGKTAIKTMLRKVEIINIVYRLISSLIVQMQSCNLISRQCSEKKAFYEENLILKIECSGLRMVGWGWENSYSALKLIISLMSKGSVYLNSTIVLDIKPDLL